MITPVRHESEPEPVIQVDEYMKLLHARIRQNNVRSIQEAILIYRFNVNRQDSRTGDTLLHYAVNMRKFNVIEALLNNLNASPNIVNFKGETAFYTACKNGHIFIVNFFVNKFREGGGMRNFMEIRDFTYELSPLLVAYQGNHIPICKVLISNGADYNYRTLYGYGIPQQKMNTVFRFSLPINFVTPQVPRRHRVTILRRNPEVVITPFETRMSRMRVDDEKTPVKMPSYLMMQHSEMLVELKKSCPICFEEYKTGEIQFMDGCYHPVCATCHPKLQSKCYFCRK